MCKDSIDKLEQRGLAVISGGTDTHLALIDLRPYGILTMLDLQRPIYAPTAAYGHFGREDIDLPWERTDKADILFEEAFSKKSVPTR